MKTLHIGVVGCGTISHTYLTNLKRFAFVKVEAVCDLSAELAKARAEEFGIKRILTLDEILSDPTIDLILNLTPPAGHYPITKRALEAGKHAFSEKPVAIRREESRELLELARKKNLRLGCAPDTVLGGGIQTARKLIDDGWIGRPLAASAFMLSPGVESWHPNPDFYYQEGAGPLYDMGPYYLTALFQLLGPIAEVAGMTSRGYAERTITTEKRFGEKIAVNVDTHTSVSLRFANGALGTLITSFEVRKSSLPRIEIYGETGSLIVPDPNNFGGGTLYAPNRKAEWQEMPVVFPYQDSFRGLGLAEMASAILNDRPHRANGDIAHHVLDVISAVYESSAGKCFLSPETQPERPSPMPLNITEGMLD